MRTFFFLLEKVACAHWSFLSGSFQFDSARYQPVHPLNQAHIPRTPTNSKSTHVPSASSSQHWLSQAAACSHLRSWTEAWLCWCTLTTSKLRSPDPLRACSGMTNPRGSSRSRPKKHSNYSLQTSFWEESQKKAFFFMQFFWKIFKDYRPTQICGDNCNAVLPPRRKISSTKDELKKCRQIFWCKKSFLALLRWRKTM